MATNKRILNDGKPFKINGEDVVVAVVKPNATQTREATKVYNKAWAEALEDGGILAVKIEQILRKQKIWDDEKQEEYVRLGKIIADGELSLRRKAVTEGGKTRRLRKDEAKKIALDMAKARGERILLVMERNVLESNTVEATARNARFNYQCSVCIINNETGDPLFTSVEDYLSRGDEPWVLEAVTQLASLVDGYDLDFQKSYPENKFLVEYKFAKYHDNVLRLIDDKGRFVDEEGRLQDANGRFINDKNEFVDSQGRRVDEKGDYILEDAFDKFADEEEVKESAATG